MEYNITIITNDNDFLSAKELLTKLKGDRKKIEEQKEKVSRPLLDALAARRKEFAPALGKYDDAITKLSSLLSEYQTKKLEEKRLLEEKILSDKRTTDETKVAKLTNVEDVQTKGFRKQPYLNVVDINKIPDEYFVLNETKVFSDLKEGKVIPGAEILTKLIPIG